MIAKLWTRVESWERRLRRSFGRDITTPAARRWSALHYHLFDHAFLRTVWPNFFPIAPGVYRSNQPTHRRFLKYHRLGIRAVLNLRGEDKHAHYLFEKETLSALGIALHDAKLWARTAPPRRRIEAVIDAMRTIERPFLLHCKSGADRAGFAAAMYLMIFENAPVEVARRQLGLKYIHLNFTATGIQDYILKVYAARLEIGSVGFEPWVRGEYRADPVQAGFDARRPAGDVARELAQA